MVDLNELREIRRILEERFPNFPHTHCLDAAVEVNQRTGLDMVEGVFLSGNGPQHHVFNYDQELRVYIDLSADQFFGISEKVLITEEDHNQYYKGIRRCFKRIN